ncbi:MAG: exosortase/archaeosortase family protein [Dehalococcoidia bacterium]
MAGIEYKKFIGPGIIAVLVIALYYPAIEWMANSWWNSDYYSHSLLLLPVALIILWSRRNDLGEKRPYQIGIWVLVAGLILYVVGFVRASNFLCAASLLLVLPGIVIFARGITALRAVAFPIALLVFMIPFPWLDRVTLWLQNFAARASAWIVDLLGVSVTRTGSQVELENASFQIGVPCSGMHSLIALLALAAILAYLLRGPFIRKLSLVILAIPVAIFSNLARLVILLLIGNAWGEDAVTGVVHDPLSPIIFVIAIICLIPLARILGLRVNEPHE